MISTSKPAARARSVMVAITSSASQPGISMMGNSSTPAILRISSNWLSRSDGVASRLAL